MDLTQLEELRRLARYLSFRSAAANSRVSPSAMSAHIKALEAEVGVPLAVRTSRRVELTPAGQVLLDETDGLARQLAQAVALARRVGQGQSRRLRIGHVDGSSVALLEAVLPRLDKYLPLGDLAVTHSTTNKLLRGLKDRRIDLALIHPPVHDVEIEEEHLLEERLVAVIPDKARTINETRRTAAGQTLIAPPRDSAPRVREAYEAAFRAVWGDPPETIQDADSITSRLLLVALGSGITFVPAAGCCDTRRPGTRLIPLDQPEASLPIHIAWRRDNTSPTLFAIREQLTKASREIAGTSSHTALAQESDTSYRSLGSATERRTEPTAAAPGSLYQRVSL